MEQQELVTERSPGAPGSFDRIILVYDGDSGFGALLLDVLNKVFGHGTCPLCAITHSPIGKRDAWRACEARFGLIVDQLHRDELPREWSLSPSELPCVLGRSGTSRPVVLVSRAEIEACEGDILALEQRVAKALAVGTAVRA